MVKSDSTQEQQEAPAGGLEVEENAVVGVTTDVGAQSKTDKAEGEGQVLDPPCTQDLQLNAEEPQAAVEPKAAAEPHVSDIATAPLLPQEIKMPQADASHDEAPELPKVLK